MFLSRVTLDLTRLPPAMLDKWLSTQQAYAGHQWLWQLFPDEPEGVFCSVRNHRQLKASFICCQRSGRNSNIISSRLGLSRMSRSW